MLAQTALNCFLVCVTKTFEKLLTKNKEIYNTAIKDSSQTE